MDILPAHRLRVRNVIARAMQEQPMFDLFGGEVTVKFRSYTVAPVS